MEKDELRLLVHDIAQSVQKMKFLTETNHLDKAGALLLKLNELRESAKDACLEIAFFEKRTLLQIPLKELPDYKTKISDIHPLDGWPHPDPETEPRHVHVLIEFITDTTRGHPELYPGDIEIDWMSEEDDADGENNHIPEYPTPSDDQLELNEEKNFDEDGFIKWLGIKKDWRNKRQL